MLTLPKDVLDKLPFCAGPTNAKIAFIGEAPGRDEDAHPSKLPFVGSSGKLLRRLIETIIQVNPWTDVYFTNTLKERPPDNNYSAFAKANPNLILQHRKLLAMELKSINANVLVPVGNIALKMLTGKDSIEKHRGSILPCTLEGNEGRKCVPIIHTAATLQRNWKTYFPVTQIDLKRIKAQSTFSQIRRTKREFVIRPTFDQVITFLHDLSKSPDIPVGVDSETLRCKIASIQLAKDPKLGLTIPFQYRNGKPYWPIAQECIIWQILSKYLEHTSTRIIGQNVVAFDFFMFWLHGFDPFKLCTNLYLDCQDAFQCLQPQLPKGLDFQTSIYTEEPYWKDEGKEWDTKQGEDEFWIYGAKDACILPEIANYEEIYLKKRKLWDFYQKHFVFRRRHMLRMSITGIKCDESKRHELKQQYIADIVVNQAKITYFCGWNVNVGSHKQMKTLVYDQMKLPKQYTRRADGSFTLSCDKHALLKLSARTDTSKSEVFSLILKQRERRKHYSDNITCPIDPDGRWRTEFGITETGRLLSRSTPIGTSSNLQNITKKMRVMFIADPGYVLLQWDLAQVEARIVAWRARDEKLIEFFTSGQDIHRQTASVIFNKSPDDINEETERYPAKRIVHASNYNMGPEKFAMIYNADVARFNLPIPMIDKLQARSWQSLYFSAFPAIRNVYQREISEIVRKTKKLTTPFGRECIFHDRIGPELDREAFAYYAQATNADLTDEIIVRTSKDVRTIEDFSPYNTAIHNTHDGAIYIVKNDEVKDLVNFIYKAAQIPISIEGRNLTVPIEFQVGDNWLEMEKVKPTLILAA